MSVEGSSQPSKLTIERDSFGHWKVTAVSPAQAMPVEKTAPRLENALAYVVLNTVGRPFDVTRLARFIEQILDTPRS